MDSLPDAIARVGNKAPHPAIVFLWLIGLGVVLSVVLSWTGRSATYQYVDPVTREVVMLVLWTLLLIAFFVFNIPLGPA